MKLNPTFKRAITKTFSRYIEINMLTILKFFEKITRINFLPYVTRALKHSFGGKVVPINTAIHPSVQVARNQDIIEIAKSSNVYGIGKCYCRSFPFYHNKKCNAPKETCIYIGDPEFLDEIEKKGYISKVPYKKIEETIRMADKMGLVHQLIYFPHPNLYYVICNCCSCCCAVISTYKKFKNTVPYLVIPSDFIARVDKSLCTNCGVCVERCHFGARIKGKNNKIIFIEENCKGCGLCATKCPKEAIKLVPRTKKN